eukprot:1995355-Prorocentrum_lima.AAC.1
MSRQNVPQEHRVQESIRHQLEPMDPPQIQLTGIGKRRQLWMLVEGTRNNEPYNHEVSHPKPLEASHFHCL